VTSLGAAQVDSPLAPPERRPWQVIASGLLLVLWILFLAAMAATG
jgi:hypothetical protein